LTPPRVVAEPVGGGPLARAAVEGRTPSGWYTPRPKGAAAWREHVEHVRTHANPDWFATLAPAFNASGAAARRLESVAQGRGVVITTGQQPGLFGGPGYTWLKALSARALADTIEQSTGIPAAPVFWAATDDADFAEASWTAVAFDEEVRRLRIERLGFDGQVMAAQPLGDVSAQYADLCAAAGSAPHLALLEHARKAYRPDATVGSAYVELMRALFEPMGIAVLDAWHPAVREAARPTLVEALRRAPVVDEAVSLRSVAIERAGFRAQVARVPKLSLVFRVSSNGIKERIPISQAGDVALQPQLVLSANVLLRPVVERALLPTMGYFGGPGEVAYFAQVGAVAEALGLPAPLVLPRWSATIVEPVIDRMLGRLGMTFDDIKPPHQAERRVGDRAMPPFVRDTLETMRHDVDARLNALRDSAEGAVMVHASTIEGARHQLKFRIDRLERRYRTAALKAESAAVRDLGSIRAALMPEGQRQERVLNPLPLVARHGEELMDLLRAGAATHAAQLLGGA
jgi:bacillithiol biosynthesis cysteine-adding enzyme BshC